MTSRVKRPLNLLLFRTLSYLRKYIRLNITRHFEKKYIPEINAECMCLLLICNIIKSIEKKIK